MEFRNTGTRFEAWDDEQLVGWLEVAPEGEAVAMPHTEVPAEFSGRGIAKALVGYALDQAAELGWSVLPYCSFVRAYIIAHPQYLPLVPPDRRMDFSL